MKKFCRIFVAAWLWFGALAGAATGAMAADPVVVTGTEHTCALQSSGGVLCWGRNHLGQLGDGTKTDRAYPVPVIGIANAIKLIAREDATCAILATADVRCWGGERTDHDGNPFDRLSPWAPGNLKALAVSVTNNQTCLVHLDGSVTCVKKTSLGYNTKQIVGVEGAVDIASSERRTCALLSNGRVKCWGLRYSNPGSFFPIPVIEDQPTLIEGLTDAVHLSSLDEYTCAVRRVGTIQCWRDFVGPQDTTPLPHVQDVARVHLSYNRDCAVLKNNDVICVGSNTWGMLGNGNTAVPTAPVKVALAGGATSFALGGNHSCATLVDGSVQCWGYPIKGQLGTGVIDYQPHPSNVVGLHDAVDVSVGETHSCAVLRDSGVACWGHNENGKLGDGTYIDRNQAVRVTGISGAAAVAAGRYHSCALMNDRTVKCWGRNISGQLGTGNFVDSLVGVDVVGLTDVTSLVAGNSHTCAVRLQGEVVCWGANNYGAVGQPSGPDLPSSFATPTRVPGVPRSQSLSARGSHTCALSMAGEVYCWGFDTAASTSSKSGLWRVDIPQATRLSSNCALTTWDTVWCDLTQETPTLMSTLNNVVQLAGDCALLATGEVHCWEMEKRAWKQVLGIANANRLSSFLGTGCAVLATGRAKCWGSDTWANETTGWSVFSRLGSGWSTSLLPQHVKGPGGNASLNLKDTTLNTTAIQADLVFAFAEVSAPLMFEPKPRESFNVDGLRVREFANSHYLGVNLQGTPRLYYKGPLSNNAIFDLGLLSGWFSLSTK